MIQNKYRYILNRLKEKTISPSNQPEDGIKDILKSIAVWSIMVLIILSIYLTFIRFKSFKAVRSDLYIKTISLASRKKVLSSSIFKYHAGDFTADFAKYPEIKWYSQEYKKLEHSVPGERKFFLTVKNKMVIETNYLRLLALISKAIQEKMIYWIEELKITSTEKPYKLKVELQFITFAYAYDQKD